MSEGCNDCSDPSVPTVNNDSVECCELTPTNCIVNSEYISTLNIGVGKTLTYVLKKIASFLKTLTQRVGNLEERLNYKDLVVNISQSSVNPPTGTTILNDFGTTVVYGYTGSGKYTLTSTASFVSGMTDITLGEFSKAWGDQVRAYYVDTNTIAIESGNSGDYVDNDIITDMMVSIRVYG